MRNIRVIMAIFFIQSVVMGSWFPRIPEVQQALGLGPATLAIALLGLPVGVLISLPFAGRLAARIGARHVIFGGFALFLLVSPLPAFAWNVQTLFIGLMLIGVAASGLELGMNVAADAIERKVARKIIATCHGFWSLGQMCGSLIGVGFAWLAVPVTWSLVAVSAAILLPALALAAALPELSDRAPSGEAKSKASFSMPSKLLLALCMFVFGIAMTEGAAADWSAVFLREVILAPTAQAGLGYTAFALAIAGGRFLGDRMSVRHGPVAVARFCGIVTMIGILTTVTSGGELQAMLGLAALGLGCSVAFPLAVTAAAAIGDRPVAANVAAISQFALAGFLVGPPMIGFVAHASNLRYGLATLLPILLLSVVLAASLRPTRPRVPSVAVAES